MFDASTVVGAALVPGSRPEHALLHAASNDRLALSQAVLAEIADVLSRPKFAGRITERRRDRVISLLQANATWYEPRNRVTECRDAKDDIYLELALEAAATIIISSDADLLALDPWRGVRIMRPAGYLSAGSGASR